VSAALKRLRDLAGDPLLVRSGAGMVPTDTALRMIEPSASILRAAEVLFTDVRGFDPQTATGTFRVAASDYLDPLFLPQLVARIQEQAPRASRIEIHPLSAASDYQAQLARARWTWWWATGSSRRRPAHGPAVWRRGGVPGGCRPPRGAPRLVGG
jgi:DNA-binding transcriptional LysR family regulator